MLTIAKALLDKNFNIVINTVLDGPDAQELAKFYLKYLNGYKITFLGIFCPVEERLKRLKNLYGIQSDVLEIMFLSLSCKNLLIVIY